MRAPPAIRKLDWTHGPLEVLAAWPRDRPVLLAHSGDGEGPGRSAGAATARWSRWSILGLARAWFRVRERSHLECAPGLDLGVDFAPGRCDPLRDLDAVLAATRLEPAVSGGTDPLPFRGGWIGSLSYDLGRIIEPTARHDPPPARDREWPLIELAWCPDALVYDHVEAAWHMVGEVDPAALAAPERAEALLGQAPEDGGWTSSLTPDGYLDAVQRTLRYIAAGDVFQANVAQRLSASFRGSPRRFAGRALARSGAWYGAYLEPAPERTILSMSPELFLEVDGTSRLVRTRPIKGTRPRAASVRELRDSEKDRAELHMIIDLMRNDLGRVCRYGTVRVPAARTMETHATVHHGVGEVTGTLRDEVSIGDLLRATFPPGSVTGAPKIRAMQIIDELEPVRRGPYCGAIGCFRDDGGISLNVAIRTALITGGSEEEGEPATIDFSVGAGIVADSDPLSEYRETLDKAGVMGMAMKKPIPAGIVAIDSHYFDAHRRLRDPVPTATVHRIDRNSPRRATEGHGE